MKLQSLIGRENALEESSLMLRVFVEQLHPAIVGALLVTCSDETERSCEEAFQRCFVSPLLPPLKREERGAFHTCNLGARYEWGSIRIAEEHFTPPHPQGVKMLVVKINSHVAIRRRADGPEFGWLQRYGVESACCGALAAMLEGSTLSAIRELAHLFAEGRNRQHILSDMRQVPLEHRALVAAAVNARLQVERAVMDLMEHAPRSPAIFLLLPCVTFNRFDAPDTELVVGLYAVDWTGKTPAVKYQGLGSDPASYHVRCEQQTILVGDASFTPH